MSWHGAVVSVIQNIKDEQYVLVVREKIGKRCWTCGFPGGQRDNNDLDPIATAKRELEEEIGESLTNLIINNSTLIDDKKKIGTVAKNGKYCAQIIMELSPNISISNKFKETEEIDKIFWVPLKNFTKAQGIGENKHGTKYKIIPHEKTVIYVNEFCISGIDNLLFTEERSQKSPEKEHVKV